MPIFEQAVRGFRTAKQVEINWDTFRGGLNTLLRETEIAKNELAQMDNLMLVGKGVPTRRWGYDNYFLAGAAGSIRGLMDYRQSNGTTSLLAITDEGYLTRKAGASYAKYTGASWASGYNLEMAQLKDKMYLVNGQRELVRLEGTTLNSFSTLSTPSSVNTTQISGASGTNTYSYKVTAVSSVGETLGSTASEITNQPQDLDDGTIMVYWTAVSAASGDLEGYNIYGRTQGYESYLGAVGKAATQFLDNGVSIPSSTTYAPTSDTTGGVVAKYILRFEDRLVYGGISGEGSRVIFGGKAPEQEKLDWSFGGGFLDIEPDAGDNITGLSIYRNRIIVFKENSIWQITLGSVQMGNFYVTEPILQLITRSHGCISNRTIVPVENDIFFLSRKGVFVLGYEPNIAIDVLRTNEISVKVRPFFEDITYSQLQNATAEYLDFKYVLSFPGKDRTIAFDRERQAWVGPWTFDARVLQSYIDTGGNEKYLFGAEDSPNVYELADEFNTDNDTAISTTLKTRREDFGDWKAFKNIKDIYTNWDDVAGDISVEFSLEEPGGEVTTASAFTLAVTAGQSGWGADMFGSAQFGDTGETPTSGLTSDVVRWLSLNKTARNMQMIIRTTGKGDDYELLSARFNAQPIGSSLKGTTWKV